MHHVRENMSVVHPLLRAERDENTKNLWNESIFRETLPVEDCATPKESLGNK